LKKFDGVSAGAVAACGGSVDGGIVVYFCGVVLVIGREDEDEDEE
jgi:hypothetical protein